MTGSLSPVKMTRFVRTMEPKLVSFYVWRGLLDRCTFGHVKKFLGFMRGLNENPFWSNKYVIGIAVAATVSLIGFLNPRGWQPIADFLKPLMQGATWETLGRKLLAAITYGVPVPVSVIVILTGAVIFLLRRALLSHESLQIQLKEAHRQIQELTPQAPADEAPPTTMMYSNLCWRWNRTACGIIGNITPHCPVCAMQLRPRSAHGLRRGATQYYCEHCRAERARYHLPHSDFLDLIKREIVREDLWRSERTTPHA
jgi:hypothetical protein